MKQKNNPWYYYLNGVLVRKRKPAMPGDIVCVDMSMYYKLVEVHQVYIGGFHSKDKIYYDWDNVVPVTSLMAERDDIKKDLEFAWDRINTLKKDLDIAYDQLHEAHGITQNLKFIISETADNMQRQLTDHINGEIFLSIDKQQEMLISMKLLNSLKTHINHQLNK